MVPNKGPKKKAARDDAGLAPGLNLPHLNNPVTDGVVQTIIDDIESQAANERRKKRAAERLAKLQAEGLAPPPVVPRYRDPKPQFGPAQVKEKQQLIEQNRAKRQDQIECSRTKLLEENAEQEQAVRARRDVVDANYDRRQQEIADLRAFRLQQAHERFEDQKFQSGRDRTALEKERQRQRADIQKVLERRCKSIYDLGCEKQRHVEMNQLRRWEDWQQSRSGWNTGVSQDEKDAILRAPHISRAAATHDASMFAIANAEATMQRNNQLLASTIGRWVGKEFVRPFTPLEWGKNLREQEKPQREFSFASEENDDDYDMNFSGAVSSQKLRLVKAMKPWEKEKKTSGQKQ